MDVRQEEESIPSARSPKTRVEGFDGGKQHQTVGPYLGLGDGGGKDTRRCREQKEDCGRHTHVGDIVRERCKVSLERGGRKSVD